MHPDPALSPKLNDNPECRVRVHVLMKLNDNPSPTLNGSKMLHTFGLNCVGFAQLCSVKITLRGVG